MPFFNVKNSEIVITFADYPACYQNTFSGCHEMLLSFDFCRVILGANHLEKKKKKLQYRE